LGDSIADFDGLVVDMLKKKLYCYITISYTIGQQRLLNMWHSNHCGQYMANGLLNSLKRGAKYEIKLVLK